MKSKLAHDKIIRENSHHSYYESSRFDNILSFSISTIIIANGLKVVFPYHWLVCSVKCLPSNDIT